MNREHAHNPQPTDPCEDCIKSNKAFEKVALEAANLMAFENFETPEQRRENGRSERGRTVNALYYALRGLDKPKDKL